MIATIQPRSPRLAGNHIPRPLRPVLAAMLLGTLLTTLIACAGGTERAAGSSEELPDWVLVYPEAEVEILEAETDDVGTAGALSLSTAEEAGKVLLYYRETLEERGYSVDTQPFVRPDQIRGGQLTAESEDGKRGLHLMVNDLESGAEGVLNYSEIP